MNRFVRLAPLASVFLLASCFVTDDGKHTCNAGFEVEIAIASANLADDCPQAAGLSSETAGARYAGDCAPSESALIGGCGGYCHQSTLQLQLETGPGTGTAHIEIHSVHLIDTATGAKAALTARNPTVWTGSSYVAWSQDIGAGVAEAKVSYQISSPNWATLSGGDEWRSYSKTYRLQVVVLVDGVPRTLTSADLMREPQVVT